MLASGPIYMTLAAALFTVMVAFVKLARAELNAFEIVIWRAVFALPVAYLLARKHGLRLHNKRLLAVRVALGFVAMSCFFTAAGGMAVADLQLISRLQPVLIAIIAPWFLGRNERPGRAVWIALVLGIVGCAVLLAPELAVGSTWGLFAVAAAVASSGAHLTLRRLGRTDHPGVVVFWFQAALLLPAGFAHSVATESILTLPPSHLWYALVGCGVSAALGQLFMTRAYQVDRAARVAAATYAGPLFGVLADILLFATMPGWDMAIGGALILVSGGLLVASRPAEGNKDDPVDQRALQEARQRL